MKRGFGTSGGPGRCAIYAVRCAFAAESKGDEENAGNKGRKDVAITGQIEKRSRSLLGSTRQAVERRGEEVEAADVQCRLASWPRRAAVRLDLV